MVGSNSKQCPPYIFSFYQWEKYKLHKVNVVIYGLEGRNEVKANVLPFSCHYDGQKRWRYEPFLQQLLIAYSPYLLVSRGNWGQMGHIPCSILHFCECFQTSYENVRKTQSICSWVSKSSHSSSNSCSRSMLFSPVFSSSTDFRCESISDNLEGNSQRPGLETTPPTH